MLDRLRALSARRIAGLRLVHIVGLSFLLSGCAGFTRSCTSFNAQTFGSDWIVVQYDYWMEPRMCWKLHNVSVVNEKYSDGIYWYDNTTKAMVHIGGWYNYEQVVNGDYAKAARSMNVDADQCHHGVYPTPPKIS